jgi:hypothetical protein
MEDIKSLSGIVCLVGIDRICSIGCIGSSSGDNGGTSPGGGLVGSIGSHEMGRILAFTTSKGEGAETPEKEEDNQKVHVVVVTNGEETRRRQVATELYTPHQKRLPLPTILLLHPHGIIYPRTEHTTMMPAAMMTAQQTTTSSYYTTPSSRYTPSRPNR